MVSFVLKDPVGMPYLGFLNPVSAEEKRRELLDYFCDSWVVDERLFECISPTKEEYWQMTANTLRHPLIFYFGHSAAFYMNKMLAAGLIKSRERINPSIEAALAVGVDEMSWDSKPGEQKYPTFAEVRNYRDEVRALVQDVLKRVPMKMPITWDSPLWALLMAIEHQRIHVETSSVLIRQLPAHCLRMRVWWPICPAMRRNRFDVPRNQLVKFTGLQVTLGKTDDTYGWDNEYGRDTCNVGAFEASQFLVSNAEFLGFVIDGGYIEEEWWDEEGLHWRNGVGAVQPPFWVGRAIFDPDRLKLRLLTKVIRMPWDWPVEVNHLEASAFCRWKSFRIGRKVGLPLESEWYRMRKMTRFGDQPDWQKLPAAPGNINLSAWGSPCPVDAFRQTPNDCCDVVGNVWQWTDTPIYGFPGFRTHPYYDDYSQPTFDGKHMVLKGGSWISTGNVALKSYRNAFRRHFHQHAGFRYVTVEGRLEHNINSTASMDGVLAQTLDFQYGLPSLGLPNYPKTLVDLAVEHCDPAKRRVALDVGCAAGRTTLELAHFFNRVIGTDNSGLLINAAARLMAGEEIQYPVTVEGNIVEHHTARWPRGEALSRIQRKVSFAQNDLCNLRVEFRRARSYDLVMVNNVLDRIREPRQFLLDIKPTITSGGLLVIACAWKWDAALTSEEEWFCGAGAGWLANDRRQSYSVLSELLRREFTEIGSPTDLPIVVRLTERRYEHSLVQVTLWRKN